MMPDNYDMFLAHDAEQAVAEKRLPICANCGEPITSDAAYNVDGLWCERCFNAWVDDIRVWVDELED